MGKTHGKQGTAKCANRFSEETCKKGTTLKILVYMKEKYENGPYGNNMGCVLDLFASGWRPEAGSCKRENEPYGSTKMREILRGVTSNEKVEANNILFVHHNCLALYLQLSGSPTIHFIIIIIIII